MTSRILVFDSRGDLADRVREAAKALDPHPEVVGCSRTRALGDFLTDRHFDVLVAGPGLDSPTGWERLRIIREEVPGMAVVLGLPAGATPDPHDLVRAGAVEVLDLPLDLDAAGPVLERALGIAARLRPIVDLTEPAEGADGPALPRRVITVASASGGCGKTFLATNLAWFLHRHGGRRVCIIDLDLQFGEVASALRLRPHSTILDLVQAADGPEEMATIVEEHCEVHETGISVLAAPRDPTEAQGLSARDIGRVIDAARRRYDDVIIDTPPALADTVVAALKRSDELLVLATLDVPSVRNLHVLLGTLERLDVDREGVRLLLNKADADAGIEVTQVLKLFPQGFDGTFPYSREVQRSLNGGRPVMDQSPDAEISRRLGEALRRLLPPAAQEAFTTDPGPTRGRGLLARARRAREVA